MRSRTFISSMMIVITVPYESVEPLKSIPWFTESCTISATKLTPTKTSNDRRARGMRL